MLLCMSVYVCQVCGSAGLLMLVLRLLAEHAMSTVDALLDLFDRLLN